MAPHTQCAAHPTPAACRCETLTRHALAAAPAHDDEDGHSPFLHYADLNADDAARLLRYWDAVGFDGEGDTGWIVERSVKDLTNKN